MQTLCFRIKQQIGKSCWSWKRILYETIMNACGLGVRMQVRALGGAGLRSNKLLTGHLRKENSTCLATAVCSLGKQAPTTCLCQHRNLLTGLHSQNLLKRKYLESVVTLRGLQGDYWIPQMAICISVPQPLWPVLEEVISFSFFFFFSLPEHPIKRGITTVKGRNWLCT